MKSVIPSHSPLSSRGLLLPIALSLPLAAVAAIALDSLELDRKCDGATFSAAISDAFSKPACRLVIHDRETDREIKVPLPRWLS